MKTLKEIIKDSMCISICHSVVDSVDERVRYMVNGTVMSSVFDGILLRVIDIIGEGIVNSSDIRVFSVLMNRVSSRKKWKGVNKGSILASLKS
jgi:hypothetical protein